MLQLRNRTRFAGTVFVSPDPGGTDSVYTIVKGTFVLGARVTPAEEQVPVAVEQQHHGDPTSTSIKLPSDVGLVKPATDVLLLGLAYCPEGHPTRQMDVSLSVGPIRASARIFGDRAWTADRTGWSISPPVPFDTMPLIWERAFGGSDRTPTGVEAELRNPVGTGYRVSKSQNPLDGLPLPNVEDPAGLISSWTDRPRPVCFAPICPHWEPRRSYAGTYDAAWQSSRAPYLPNDFDSRFFQVAPPPLIAPHYLLGGEQVEAVGVTADGVLRCTLPAVRLQIVYRVDNALHRRVANLDTVLLCPDEHRVILVWKSCFSCDKRTLRVREIEVSLAS